MAAETKKLSFRCGFSLVDVLVAVAILLIAIIGTSRLRYYSAMDARKAGLRIGAARTGLLLCENWRGVNGSGTYDPVASLGSDVTISTGTGPSAPSGFTSLGSYTINLNGTTYYATLSWRDVQTGLRALNIIVAWPLRNQAPTGVADADRSFELTTYALI